MVNNNINGYVQNIKNTRSFLLLLFLYSSIFVFVSINGYTFTETAEYLFKIFLSGIGNDHFFSIFDFIVILISLGIIRNFNVNYQNASGIEKTIFWFAVLCFMLKMVNPNNASANPIFGLPLLSDSSNYLYILFLGVIFFLRRDDFLIFIRSLFKIVTPLVIIRSIILLFYWALGKGNYFFGVNSAVLENDTLLIFGLFQNVFLCFFLISKKKKYLVASILVGLVSILSYRRGPVFVSCGTSLVLLFIYFIKNTSLLAKNLILVCMSIMVLYGFMFYDFNSLSKNMYVERYLGIFDNTTTGFSSDSGHFEQTQNTMETVINELGFWGVGYGRVAYLEGAYNGYIIHNLYASLWINYGIYMVLYYLFIIVVIVSVMLKINIKNNKYMLLKLCASAYFILFMLEASFEVSIYVEKSKMFTFLILLMGFILKYKNENKEIISINKRETHFE